MWVYKFRRRSIYTSGIIYEWRPVNNYIWFWIFSISIPRQEGFWGHINHDEWNKNNVRSRSYCSSTMRRKVRWIFKDDYGISHEVYIKAYYIPTSSVKLFGPQSYFIQEQVGGFSLDKDGSVFTFASGKTLTFKYSNRSRLSITNCQCISDEGDTIRVPQWNSLLIFIRKTKYFGWTRRVIVVALEAGSL